MPFDRTPDAKIEAELWAGDQANTAHEERAAHELLRRRLRIDELEGALRELLDAFNPEPRVSTRLTIWGRAAMTLDGTPDADNTSS